MDDTTAMLSNLVILLVLISRVSPPVGISIVYKYGEYLCMLKRVGIGHYSEFS